VKPMLLAQSVNDTPEENGQELTKCHYLSKRTNKKQSIICLFITICLTLHPKRQQNDSKLQKRIAK
jgi:hypothetical protein